MFNNAVRYSSCDSVCTRIGVYRYVIHFTVGLACCNYES